jgi:hypothetical protein
MISFKYLLLLFTSALFISPHSCVSQDRLPSLIGNWGGSYTCAQGSTGLTLIIDSQMDTHISGYFYFYPPQNNPQAKEGCYKIKGSIDATRKVTLEALHWISHPSGYVMVGLEGKFTPSNKALNGNVVAPYIFGPRCTSFAISKISEIPSIPAICKGSDLVTRLNDN